MSTDRQASRANVWHVELRTPEGWYGGGFDVTAPDRLTAWETAHKTARDNRHLRGGDDEPSIPYAMSTVPLTAGESDCVLLFLRAGASLGYAARKAAGLDVVEPRHGRAYVDEVSVLIDDRGSIPADLSYAERGAYHGGSALEIYDQLALGMSTINSVGSRQSEPRRWARCHASVYPELFRGTGRWQCWCIQWPEDTAPVFDSERDAHHCARVHSWPARLVLDGETIATMHCDHEREHGGSLLRMLNPDGRRALDASARAMRLLVALGCAASMIHSRPDVEYVGSPAELDTELTDPRATDPRMVGA